MSNQYVIYNFHAETQEVTCYRLTKSWTVAEKSRDSPCR